VELAFFGADDGYQHNTLLAIAVGGLFSLAFSQKHIVFSVV
jgi:hypothetical protein